MIGTRKMPTFKTFPMPTLMFSRQQARKVRPSFRVCALINPDESAPPTRPISQLIPHVNDKMPKPRWHFGIRSRSPPMEVMLEIYKTLALLGMQWKRKEGIEFPDVGPPTAEGYPVEVHTALAEWEAANGGPYPMGRKAPPKKEILAKEKAAQDLYLVQTRARYGSVMVSQVFLSSSSLLPSDAYTCQVRMDLQLYKVDSENFLVDFKNIGYYPATDVERQQVPEANSEVLSSSHGHGSSTTKKPDSIGGVSGPFHFLEMACQLIAELAS